MKTQELDYPLPPGAIARRPPRERDGGRMLVLARGGVSHEDVRRWAELVPENALVVLNDTRVRRARLFCRKVGSGGKVELLLLRALEGATPSRVRFEALGRANRPLSVGTRLDAPPFEVCVLERQGDGTLHVEVVGPGDVEAELERSASMPIPPYLDRPDDAQDTERYQTVYARHLGSVAAPTAGLHLTESMLARLRDRGVRVASLTLHVGVGTFRPVSAERLEDHEMHAERLRVGDDLVGAVHAARRDGAAVVAVGTTVVRGLEAAADPERAGHVHRFDGETRLMIHPGYAFRVVDALLTNFHQPKSTLLALVAAFAGLDATRRAYAAALSGGYRLLSYGDAMWIPERRA